MRWRVLPGRLSALLLTVLLAAFLAAALPGPARAAESASQQEVQPRLYRYEQANGTVAISNHLTRQAIYAGYQVLNLSGRVLKTVAPAPPESRAKRQRQAAAREAAEERAKRDEALLQLYGGPQGAVRARDRKVEALQLKVNYARHALERVRKKRAGKVSDAARAERTGRQVPEHVREAIKRYGRQIQDKRRHIEDYQAQMKATREHYAPIIKRLQVLRGKD